MQQTLDPRIALPLAALAMLASVWLWYTLVRVPPLRRAPAVVVDRRFEEARTVDRSIPRAHRSLEYMPHHVHYTQPERHVYTLRLEDGSTATYATPDTTGPVFEPGDTVDVTFCVRRTPLLSRRVQVLEARPRRT